MHVLAVTKQLLLWLMMCKQWMIRLIVTRAILAELILTQLTVPQLIMTQLLVLHDHCQNGRHGQSEQVPDWNAVVLQRASSEDDTTAF